MRAAAHVRVLVEAVGPALVDALLGPQVVRVFGQRVHQLLHLGGQGHGAQVEGRWFVTVTLLRIILNLKHNKLVILVYFKSDRIIYFI